MIQSKNDKEIYLDTLDSPKGYKEFSDLVHKRYNNFLWVADDPRYYKLFIKSAKKVIKKSCGNVDSSIDTFVDHIYSDFCKGEFDYALKSNADVISEVLTTFL